MPDALSGDTGSESFSALLIREGKLSEAALERATRLQAESGEQLEIILTKLGLVSERDLAAAYADFLDLPLIGPRDFPDAPVLADRISRKFLKKARAIPLKDGPEGLAVAMADPCDDFTAEALGFVTGRTVLRRVAVPMDVEAAFERLYGDGKSSLGEITEGIDAGADEAAEDIERLKDSASEAPVIRLVNLLIVRAVESRASDIHIEPMEDRLQVRYRIDGVLQEVEAPPNHLRAAIISRVKIMAKLNIAERRLAQDGRIQMPVRGKDIDFRVSTTPTIYGESLVLRILDRSSVALDFASLGFDDDLLAPYMKILALPHGILLVTGPTGSGKTTTLYTSLLALNKPDVKILTIEDPVEYHLTGINQVQVKPQIGHTFATALRSFLRQDPDIMMVGEIRDLETAQIAVQAALTGHLILSTLHTNDAASAVTRLLDMGLEDYLLTSTINGIVGQRLVRRLCPRCSEPHEALPDLVQRLGLDGNGKPVILHRPVGCEHCSSTGYFGRTTILEVLPIADPIRRLILQHAEAREIQRIAMDGGMQTMFQHGLRKALAGLTTVEEVLRVTREF